MSSHQTSSIIFIIFILLIIASCQSFQQKKPLSTEEQLELITIGNKITEESFRALSGELMGALQEGGIQNAIGYCHLQASPIIDSLSAAYGVVISRVSDKNRNPENKPDDSDLLVIASYREQLAEGRELRPHLDKTGTARVYYSPIVIQNPACLLCHGKPGNTVEQENYDFIIAKYPDDLATGYQLGDLRGVWKIDFGKEN